MSSLFKEASPFRGEVLSLCPAALSSEQLWGSFPPATRQWQDGLASAFLRKASQEDSAGLCMRVLVLRGQLSAALQELIAQVSSLSCSIDLQTAGAL